MRAETPKKMYDVDPDELVPKRPALPMFQRARELRREATPAERRLWELVRGRRCGGYRFLRQAPAGHFVLDFYCPAARLAIEVDGGVHDLPNVRVADRARQGVLEEELGITFLRLTNEDVLRASDDALSSRIVSAAEKAVLDAGETGARPARLR